ncbi:MAG TPA: hypothetical protein QF813_10545 [Alphaproteobacteria bacterium]|jgi:hypothetical protein|nr:hypothetical protein [Alphaproteobacteria bacterium]HJM61911.1 hypothetical protein [Alphaproteobacteria bacterium]
MLNDRRALFGAEDPEPAVFLLGLASHYLEMDRIDDAMAVAEKAGAVRQSFADKDEVTIHNDGVAVVTYLGWSDDARLFNSEDVLKFKRLP